MSDQRDTAKRIEERKELDGNLGKLGFSQYEVTDYGLVINLKTNKILRPFVDRGGYENYSLWSDEGERKTFRVHRLVAELFVQNPHNNPHINHIDGNKQNNNWDNLEWVTDKQNREHAKKYLTPKKQMSEDDARIICTMLEDNHSEIEVSKMTGISRRRIADIYYRRSFTNISKDYNF